jgi:hypothetical protein
VNVILSCIGLALAAYVLRRLWRSRRQIGGAAGGGKPAGPIIRTPLHDLESVARRHLGPRPPGKPFAEWLAGLRASIGDTPLLDEAIRLHQRLRFDPMPPAQGHRECLAVLARRIAVMLKKRPHR